MTRRNGSRFTIVMFILAIAVVLTVVVLTPRADANNVVAAAPSCTSSGLPAVTIAVDDVDGWAQVTLTSPQLPDGTVIYAGPTPAIVGPHATAARETPATVTVESYNSGATIGTADTMSPWRCVGRNDTKPVVRQKGRR